MSFKSNTGTIIDRAINELRTGRPLIIQNNKEYWMFFNIEPVSYTHLRAHET